VTSRPLTLEPIGYVRTALQFKDEAPRQPRASGGAPGRIELLSGRNYEHALLDLSGWDHIWVLFWFHHNAGWRPKVLPPRRRSVKEPCAYGPVEPWSAVAGAGGVCLVLGDLTMARSDR